MTASQLVPVVPATIGNVQCLTVDGRALHGVLGVRRDFSNWIKGRISKYGFVQGHDFEVFAKSGENTEIDSPNLANQKMRGGDRRSLEYRCSLDMGKELCMVENNENGRIARRYFIECERRLLAMEQQPQDAALSPLHRAELKALVDAKLSTHPASVQGKARAEIWTRFNRHFQIAEYAQLPQAKMPEARDYLIGLEVKALQALPPAPAHAPVRTPAPAWDVEHLPKAMPESRKEILKRINRLSIEARQGFSYARNLIQMNCHPGVLSMKMNYEEREIWHLLESLQQSADESLAAAYNAISAGYRLGLLVGRE